MKSTTLCQLIIGIALLACSTAAVSAKQQYVEVKQAVVNFTALQPGQQAVAAIVVTVKPGFHTQSHTPHDESLVKFEVKPDPAAAITFFDPVYPPGTEETYTFSNTPLNVYTGTLTIYVPFQVKPDAAIAPIKISGTLSYQACNDNGCFQPTATNFSIESKIVPAGESISPQNADLFKKLPENLFKSTAPAVAAPPAEKIFGAFVLAHNSYLLAFVAAFLAGIIFNAVPCVLPVLPLKAIGFYEVSQHNRAKCLAFGAMFSLGLIASFAALALLIVVYKKVGWGEIYSKQWFNLAIVVILLVMAVGTFGAFTVNLPVGIYNITPRHDTFLGNFLFGILTAILSTPCTFGLFVSLLVWAGTQPTIIGVSLVMTVGAGMAFPYFLLSAFPEVARRFPRTGPWSELVKQSMSFLLLGSAVFFARRFIKPWIGDDAFWWMLFAVAVIAGLFLVVRTIQISKNLVPRLVTALIALLLIGGTFVVVHKIVQRPFDWVPYTQKDLDAAEADHRVIVVDFTATWCTTCQYLEVHTLYTPDVVKVVKSRNVEMLKADLTSDKAEGWPLLREKADLISIPFTLVYGPGVSQPIKLNGIYSPAALIAAIDQAGKKTVSTNSKTVE